MLCEAYHEKTLENGQQRTVLKLKPHLSPIKVAVVPLAKNKTQIVDLSLAIVNSLKAQRWGRVVFENTGNIGKTYRRHDEIGTPVCVTVDFESIGAEDTPVEVHNTVTVRDRDSLKQVRVAVDDLIGYLNEKYFNF